MNRWMTGINHWSIMRVKTADVVKTRNSNRQ